MSIYRYFTEGRVKMIEIVVDPTNTVTRPATEEDEKNYPAKGAVKTEKPDEEEKKK